MILNLEVQLRTFMLVNKHAHVTGNMLSFIQLLAAWHAFSLIVSFNSELEQVHNRSSTLVD